MARNACAMTGRMHTHSPTNAYPFVYRHSRPTTNEKQFYAIARHQHTIYESVLSYAIIKDKLNPLTLAPPFFFFFCPRSYAKSA